MTTCYLTMGIGRPATTYNAATKFHERLLRRHPPGTAFASKDVKGMIVRAYKVGINQAENIFKTGVAAGYWTTDARRGVAGHTILQAANPPAPQGVAEPQATPA